MNQEKDLTSLFLKHLENEQELLEAKSKLIAQLIEQTTKHVTLYSRYTKENQSTILKQPDLSAWEKDPCPSCGKLTWIRIRRNTLQKIFYRKHKRCQCLECGNEFWQTK